MSENQSKKNSVPQMPQYADLTAKPFRSYIDDEVLDFTEDLEREEKYKDEMLQTLKNIEANTTGLNEIVSLLSGSVEKQDEILEFLKDSLAIGASENREEAESKLRKMMNKATTLSTDIETIQKLSSFATTVFNMFTKINS